MRSPAWLRPIALPGSILLGLLLFYSVMFLRYRPYDIDNPWFLSFSYNLCTDRIETDRFAENRFPAGMDGTQFFGKLAAYPQCAILSGPHWQQQPAALMSSILVILALGLWWLVLRRLGYGPAFAACFLIAAGVSEPFLAAANKFRYEPMSFLLISLGMLLATRRRPFLAALAAGLAVEIEPMAVTGVLAVLLLAWYTNRPAAEPGLTRSALGLRAVTGLALAAAICLALHPRLLHIASMLPNSGVKGEAFSGGFFAAYFSRMRHLPELACFLTAAVVYLRRRAEIPSHYPAIAAALLAAIALLVPHGNQAYMIFVYPFLVVLALDAFHAERRPWLIAGLVLLYVLPQQIALAHLNADQGYTAHDIEPVSTAIAHAANELGIGDPQLRIFGDYRLWFAHPHLYRAALERTANQAADADLYLCFDRAPEQNLPVPQLTLYCPDLEALLPLRPVGSIAIRNQPLRLFVKR